MYISIILCSLAVCLWAYLCGHAGISNSFMTSKYGSDMGSSLAQNAPHDILIDELNMKRGCISNSSNEYVYKGGINADFSESTLLSKKNVYVMGRENNSGFEYCNFNNEYCNYCNGCEMADNKDQELECEDNGRSNNVESLRKLNDVRFAMFPYVIAGVNNGIRYLLGKLFSFILGVYDRWVQELIFYKFSGLLFAIENVDLTNIIGYDLALSRRDRGMVLRVCLGLSAIRCLKSTFILGCPCESSGQIENSGSQRTTPATQWSSLQSPEQRENPSRKGTTSAQNSENRPQVPEITEEERRVINAFVEIINNKLETTSKKNIRNRPKHN